MAEIIFRLPSKQVTYGYVEVKGTPEEFGIHDIASPDAVGMAYLTYVRMFLEGEQDAFKHSQEQPTPKAETPPPGASNEPSSDAHDAAIHLIKDSLGATEVPWEEKVAPRPKPWETGSKPQFDFS